MLSSKNNGKCFKSGSSRPNLKRLEKDFKVDLATPGY